MDDFRMHGWYCFVSDNRCLVMNDLITENMKLHYFLMLYSLLIKHDHKVFFLKHSSPCSAGFVKCPLSRVAPVTAVMNSSRKK